MDRATLLGRKFIKDTWLIDPDSDSDLFSAQEMVGAFEAGYEQGASDT